MFLFNNCFIKKKTLNDYCFIKKIKKGSFSKVSIYISKLTNKDVIIKKIYNTKSLNNYELTCLLTLKYEFKYTVNLLDYIDSNNCLYLIMDKFNGESLSNLMKRTSYLDYDKLFIKLILGLDKIHYLNCYHGDINSDNIMIYIKNNTFYIQFIDFEHGYFHNYKFPYEIYKINLYNNGGKLVYCSPEVYYGKYYNAKADCWSMGVLLYQLYMGIIPYPDIYKKSIYNNKYLFNKKLEDIPNKIYSKLILNNLEINQTKRWPSYISKKYLENIINI